MIKGKKIIVSILILAVMCFVAVFSINYNKLFANAENAYEIEYIPIERVEISSKETTVQPGQSVPLEVKFTPYYAAGTVQEVVYKIIAGADSAQVTGNILTVNSDAKAGSFITVQAIADGVKSFNSVRFTVIETPVESVKFNNEQTSIYQGDSLQLLTTVSPYNASNKNVIYTITKGSDYATVNTSGLIKVNNNLPAGNLILEVTATSVSDLSKYDVIKLNLYVPTRNLNLGADNKRPEPGESFTLIPDIDIKASAIVPQYEVLSGEEYIEDFTDNTVTLKDNISDYTPYIIVRATRDGLTAECKVNIYIPTAKLTVISEKQTIKQGEMLQLRVETNPLNADLSNLQLFLAEGGEKYATIDSRGVLTAKILPDIAKATVDVYAKIDDVVSGKFTIIIEKTNIVLTADKYFPTSSDNYAETVSLTTLKDDEVQSSSVNYTIKKGGEFIDGSVVNGTFKLKTNITAFNPQIILSARVGEFESGDLIINIKILAQSVLLENLDINEVEQQRKYSFKGSILPVNATLVDEALTYCLNVDKDIAEINKDGILTVKETAPVGQNIIITVKGPDGISFTHKVTVATVYATKLEIVGAFKEGNSDRDIYNLASPGDIIKFSVIFPEPFNVSKTQQVYSLSLLEGDIDVATIKDNTVVINSHITKMNPLVVVRVHSDQNGTEIYQDYTIEVYIPVTDVVLSTTAMANEGERVSIDSVINTLIYPLNSTVRFAEYVIVAGDKYAYIDGDELVITDNVSSGNLTFSIKAIAEGIESNTVIVGVYVKTKTLSVSASNYNPQSRIASGDRIIISSATDERATMNNPTITVISGAEYIAGGYKNGDVIPNTFDIEKNLTKVGVSGAIKLKAEQDGIIRYIDDIVIYVPVESFSLGLPKTIDRGTEITLTPIYNGYVNGYVTILGWTLESFEGSVEKIGDKLYVDKTTPAGSVIVITYRSAEPGAEAVTDYITVNALNGNYSVVYGSPSSYPSNFTIGYGSVIKGGCEDVAITSKLQIEEGGYTDIVIKYDGQKLNNFGIENCSFEFISGSDCANVTDMKDGVFRLNINAGTSGDQLIKFRVKVVDGKETYSSYTQLITVFKKYTTATTQTYITEKETNLTLNLSDNASPLSGVKFVAEGASGYSLTEDGKLTITSYKAIYDLAIKITAVQRYNGKSYEVVDTFKLSLPHLSISDESGLSASHIISIPGVSDSISMPYRSGYVLVGYFTSGSGGTEYYSKIGILQVSHSNYRDISTLYARWTPINYEQDIMNDNTITAKGDYSYKDEINPGFDVSILKSLGYTSIKITIEFDCEEKSDGYQDIKIYSGSALLGETTEEHGGNKKDTNRYAHTVRFTVSIDNFDSNFASFYIGWGAHGSVSDNWILGYRNILVEAIKPSNNSGSTDIEFKPVS